MLNFPIKKNVVKFDTFLAGLGLAKKIQIKDLVISVDSQLIARQLLSEYQTHDPLFLLYCAKVLG